MIKWISDTFFTNFRLNIFTPRLPNCPIFLIQCRHFRPATTLGKHLINCFFRFQATFLAFLAFLSYSRLYSQSNFFIVFLLFFIIYFDCFILLFLLGMQPFISEAPPLASCGLTTAKFPLFPAYLIKGISRQL